MGLKLELENLDEVDALIKPLYVERGGKFVLPVDDIPDVERLHTKARIAEKEAIESRKKLDSWKSFGKTPEEIQALLDAQEQKASTEAERKGEWDKLKSQMNDKHQKDIAEREQKIQTLNKRLEQELIDARATAAIAAAKGVPDLLLPIVQRHVKVDENYRVIVVDSKGDPRIDGKGDPLTISDLVNEMRSSEIYGRAFEGSGQSGGGTPPANGSTGGSGSRVTKADLEGTTADKRKARAAFIDLYGTEAFFNLPSK